MVDRPLVLGGVLAVGVLVVLVSVGVIGVGGGRPIGHAGPPIAAGGLLIAAFALLGFE